jgi:hypothetical protein
MDVSKQLVNGHGASWREGWEKHQVYRLVRKRSMDDSNIEPAAPGRFMIVWRQRLLNERRCDGEARAQVGPAEPISTARGMRCVTAATTATGGIEGEDE